MRPFIARVGALLVSPGRALVEIDRRGGGVSAAAWLVLLGLVCFRLEDLVRAALGVSRLPLEIVLRQALAPAAVEAREALLLVLPLGVALSILGRRGHRDLGRDGELAGACFVPYFAVRAVARALDAQGLVDAGPRFDQASRGLALGWALLLFALALRVARARPAAAAPGATTPGRGAAPAPGASAPAPSSAAVAAPAPLVEPSPAGPPDRSSPWLARLAGAVLLLALGVGLLRDGRWVAEHAAALRPFRDGAPAPDFTLPRVDGRGPLRLSDLRGKVVLLDFWATWCSPCVRMLPTLEGLYEEWRGRGVEFVGVSSDGPGALGEVRAFLSARPVSYPMVFDDASVGNDYKVVALPHLVLLDREGAVRHVFVGTTTRRELADALSRAVD